MEHGTLLTTVYMPETCDSGCSLTLVWWGLTTQPYTDGSSASEGPALLLMIIYWKINNYLLHENHQNYI